MLSFFKIALVFISLYATVNAGAKSCRQCTGTQYIDFKTYVTLEDVAEYLDKSLGPCATGMEFGVTGYYNTASTCLPNTQKCKSWHVGLNVWRYCGNGGTVSKSRPGFCNGGICAFNDNLNLKCTQSVECHSGCDLPNC